MSIQSYHEQVREIKRYLTPETWGKKQYISLVDNKMCFCVHGAAQGVSNPKVRAILGEVKADQRDQMERASWACSGENAASRAGDAWYSFRGVNGDGDLHLIWKNRGNKGANLHYLLGMFGITASFNDARDTTLKMLHDKLDECAAWAEANEGFLQSN